MVCNFDNIVNSKHTSFLKYLRYINDLGKLIKIYNGLTLKKKNYNKIINIQPNYMSDDITNVYSYT